MKGGRLRDLGENQDGRFELSVLFEGDRERIRWSDQEGDGLYHRVERTGDRLPEPVGATRD